MVNKIFKTAKWITTTDFAALEPVDIFHKECERREIELPQELKNYHISFKNNFTYNEASGDVSLKITADDYYKLYINDRFVGQGPAQGYYFCYYWNEYNITEYLKSGENNVTVEVYYNGLINRAFNSADRRMGLIAEASDSLGNIVFETSKLWDYQKDLRYKSSRTIGYDTLFAEDFDNRAGFAEKHKAFEKQADYTFSPIAAKPLQVYSKFPISEIRLENGGSFYDFGEEITAHISFKAFGKSGQKIRILCGEETDNSPEKVRFNMRCNCLNDETFIIKEGQNNLVQYDYKAFRYLTLIPEENVEISDVCAVVRHYPFDDSYATLKTDNEVLKSVWNICKNGIKYGAQEVFVDCPEREKGQYSGDLTITSASHIILTGDLSLFKKAIDNQMQSSAICKGIMAVTPGSFMQEIADYSLQFPILALRYYKLTGDKEYLAECLNVCEGICEHFSEFARPDGLLQTVSDKWNLVDWPDNLRDGYDFELTLPVSEGTHNVINAFYIGCVKQTEEIRDILGINKPKISPALTAAFNKVFFNTETGLYTDSDISSHSAVHSNIFPLYYGLCEDNQKEKIADFIVSKGLCMGVYVAYFMLKALCNAERYEDALKIITSTDENSWYNMVREGGTTCFEAWGKDKKFNTSLCHPWASGPISVLAEDILPNMPNVGKIIYK